MSLKTGQTVDNINLKFLELKKYLISSENITGFDTISIDNNQSTVFVLNGKKLFVIPFNDLLAFEWNKSVVNEICEQFNHISIELNFRPHLVSVSAKGFGNKLAVCGADDQNESPFIIFYDLQDIYKNHSKSCPYSRINLINSRGLVSELVWHSEFCDNQFGCCLTDGSLFIISIGDIETKTTTILSYLPSNSNSMSLCWSPKGKQLVVGHKNGFFSQYKLVNGQQMQEVKKIGLIEPFSDYNVVAIKWIVSSLFTVAISKDLSQADKDVHILFVSTPSKATPQFVDFGALCLDNFEVEGIYKINLYHFNNVILCATTMSSEVSVLGCDFDKDTAVLDNWCQWILDDSSRIDLPMDNDGNETYMRGIVISKGTKNIYKLNSNETYGGVNCPILFVYNSAAILVPFLVIDKSGRLRGLVPPNIVKPTVTASTPTVPQQKQLTSTPIVTSTVGSHPNVPQRTVFETPPTNQIPIFNPQPKLNPKPLQTPPQSQKSSAETPSASSKQFSIRDIISTPTPTQNAPQKTSNTETDTKSVANELYITAIKDQINEFKKLINETKRKYSKIQSQIGDNEEKLKLKTNSRLVEEVLKELKENFKGCSKDINVLQSSLIESFSLLEEAKSIIDRNVDPNYRNLLHERALDPITERRFKQIQALDQYIETQLRELDAKFEQEWYEWLEKKKALKSDQPNRIRANSGLDLIYKALNNNQRIINVLKRQLTEQNLLVFPLRKKPDSIDSQAIDKLTQNLNKSSLSDFNDDMNEKLFKLKSVSEKKRNNLKEFFENRPNVAFIRPVENTSRFMSAIEKIKEKQSSAEKSRLSLESIANKSVNSSPTIIKSTDNKVDIIPTLVTTPKISQSSFVPKNKKIEKPEPIGQSSQTISSESKTSPPKAISNSFPATTPLSSTKPLETFQASSQKPISFDLKPNIPSMPSQMSPFPTISTTVSKPINQINQFPIKTSFSLKTQTPDLSGSSAPISLSTKPKPEATKKSETQNKELDLSTGSSKSVSFGNTTIINPIETTTEDSFKLDTITELSETGDSVSVTDSPFSSFKGFGGFGANTPKDTTPKLSFNLNKSAPTSGFTFNLNTPVKTSDAKPKYEDITPPSSPQKTVAQPEEVKEQSSNEEQNTKPSSILKTTLSTKTNADQSESSPKSPESSILRSLISGSKPSDQPAISIFPLPISSPPISSSATPSISVPTPSTPQLTITSGSAPKPTDATSQKPQALSFGSSPSFGQTSQSSPFSGGFSFGNTSSLQPLQTGATQSPLSFGFGSNQSSSQSSTSPTTTTIASTGLSFGQQSNVVNNLSFCGLGGSPNPENAQKNIFGGSFSSPPLQTPPQPPAFGSNTQSSPFSVKTSSSGLFSGGGSFSSGSGGVAQTGFGGFGAVGAQQQQTQPVFGGSPLFGSSQPAFGGSPTFVGAPAPQPAFGSAPAFGGPPAMGALTASSFGSQSTAAFGANTGFANSANSGLSFGALASSAQPSNPQSTSPFGGGFTGFSQTPDSFSFTQRRK